MRTLPALAVTLLGLVPVLEVQAALDAGATENGDWIPWLLLGGIALLVAGIALKMVLSARFSKGYGAWARSRRGAFEARNAQWDSDDEKR